MLLVKSSWFCVMALAIDGGVKSAVSRAACDGAATAAALAARSTRATSSSAPFIAMQKCEQASSTKGLGVLDTRCGIRGISLGA